MALALMGGAKLSKSLIQFSIEGLCSTPSLLFDLRPNYGGGNEDNSNLLQNVSCMHCYTQCLQSWSKPPSTRAFIRDSWILMGKSGSVSCGVTTSFSWVLMHRKLFVSSKNLFPQYCVSSDGSVVRLMETSSKRLPS